tara:strand:- start:92 stop:493 length:402 start_codon:yes stop_codon:yes gene_type:complete
MKAVGAKVSWGLNIGSLLVAADNSGARIVKIVAVKGGKGRKARQQPAKLGDWIKVSVKKGTPELKGKVFDAVLIRQKKSYRRYTGERIAFMDNAAALLKDDKGNPQGTQIKGPVAREIANRWPQVSKIAQFVV